ncbi:FUSC family protein [Novosphingobium sediminicola]|uniref:FUSC family protein n=1 Tax=Novosphingobium sediminicola TaxID=563162 RepID=UPI0016142EC6|nr:FUSC family protein [Novosphingobium sediminicola]
MWPPQPLTPRPLTIDRRKLLFSISSFVAAAITLAIAFAASLPRPWWALLTVYVTAQPMAGAFRPKVIYRLLGIAVGAITALTVVPNLQNSPALLVLVMAAWTGLCIALAVLDRSPRAFLFQMAAFSSAVISFPYLDDPANIFDTTIARVEEMAVAILCVTAVHALFQPWRAIDPIRERADTFLEDAAAWCADAVAMGSIRAEPLHRRKLATDITEIGMIALHLPFDDPAAPATRSTIRALQHELTEILPLASAAANRLALLDASGGCGAPLMALRDRIAQWLGEARAGDEAWIAQGEALARLAGEGPEPGAHPWTDLLRESAAMRMGGMVTALVRAHRLAATLGAKAPDLSDYRTDRFPLARDYGIAAMAGLATAAAIMLYCAVWVLLAWPAGSATAAFAALITCSFAAQDDPAPVIGRYLTATLRTIPLAALYLFVILPRVDGWFMLVLTLAPALIRMGYIQADPARSAQALPMFSCFIVAMGFLSRFQGDFAAFINTGLAQIGGIVTTLAITRLFRSVEAQWSLRRVLSANWSEMARLADIRRPFRAGDWSARATDRMGQIAARMALSSSAGPVDAADALADLRIGRNVLPIRGALPHVPHAARHHLGEVLAMLVELLRQRGMMGQELRPANTLCSAIDGALAALLALASDRHRHAALAALVGMRCNLFPDAAPPHLEVMP